MVFMVEDPRGYDTAARNRYNYKAGPFKYSYFTYGKAQFMDWFHKYPRIASGMICLGLFAIVFPIQGFRLSNNLSGNSNTYFNGPERHYEYTKWGSDFIKRRGEWNNNFKCWMDWPDCGKDYKKVYNN